MVCPEALRRVLGGCTSKTLPPLCSGLARRPLKAVAPVRIRSGVPAPRPGPGGPGLLASLGVGCAAQSRSPPPRPRRRPGRRQVDQLPMLSRSPSSGRGRRRCAPAGRWTAARRPTTLMIEATKTRAHGRSRAPVVAIHIEISSTTSSPSGRRRSTIVTSPARRRATSVMSTSVTRGASIASSGAVHPGVARGTPNASGESWRDARRPSRTSSQSSAPTRVMSDVVHVPALVSTSRHRVRFPPERPDRVTHDGAMTPTAPGRRVLLPGRQGPRPALRRGLLHRRAHHRHLLPPLLPGAHPGLRQRDLPPDVGGGTGGRVPGLQAVPARRHAGQPRLGRRRRHRRAGDAADRRRGGRPRRGPGSPGGSATPPATSGASSPPSWAPGRWRWRGPAGPRPPGC